LQQTNARMNGQKNRWTVKSLKAPCTLCGPRLNKAKQSLETVKHQPIRQLKHNSYLVAAWWCQQVAIEKKVVSRIKFYIFKIDN